MGECNDLVQIDLSPLSIIAHWSQQCEFIELVYLDEHGLDSHLVAQDIQVAASFQLHWEVLGIYLTQNPLFYLDQKMWEEDSS